MFQREESEERQLLACQMQEAKKRARRSVSSSVGPVGVAFEVSNLADEQLFEYAAKKLPFDLRTLPLLFFFSFALSSPPPSLSFPFVQENR